MKYILPFLLLYFASSCASTQANERHATSYSQDYIEKTGALSVDQTVLKLEEIIAAKKDVGMKLFAIIDHKAGATSVNLELNDAKVIIFGNPNVGTKLMQANPKLALELPMKILVYEEDGITHIRYKDPLVWGRHLATTMSPLLLKISGLLNNITDAATK